MQPDVIIKPKTLPGLVQGLSGMFVSKTSTGLTPKELKVLSVLVFVCKQKETRDITPEVREAVAEITGHSKQVVTNYMGKLKRKNAITQINQLHHYFLATKIAIIYDEEQN